MLTVHINSFIFNLKHVIYMYFMHLNSSQNFIPILSYILVIHVVGVSRRWCVNPWTVYGCNEVGQ